MLRTRLGAALVAVLAAIAVVVVPQHSPAQADASGRGGDFVAFTAPRQVLNTTAGAKPGPGTTTAFAVVGVAGIPATGVGSVLIRVAAVAPTASTWLTVYPDGATRPAVSMINAAPTETLSNTAMVRVGGNGKLAVFNAYGSTHIVVEVQGYFTTSTGSTWGGLVPVTQHRLVDTRTGLGTPAGQIAANASRTFDLTPAGVPDGASGAVLSLTVPSTATAAGAFHAAPAGSAVPASPIMNYENSINSASGAMTALTSDGRVTFTNKGTKPADLILDVVAYFTKTPNAGAGFRPVTSRLYTATLAANAVVDVQVGGTNGMPLRGIAGAALSLQASGTAYGALRAWPTGAAEPAPTFTQHHPGTGAYARASAVVTPGIDGKVRIRNISTAATLIYVDLEGWFADPIPAVPVAQYAPVSVLQPAPPSGQPLSTIEYAYTDNIGTVRIGHQTDPGNFGSIQWTPISGNEAFSGRPALSRLPDGRVQAAVQYTDGDIWVSSQTAVGSGTWNGWTDFGGSMAGPPAAAVLGNGIIVQFAVDVDGKLWAFGQTGSLPSWRNLGDQNLTGSPTVVMVRDGAQVFARSTDGTIATILYRADGTLSAWANLGGSGAGTPAVVVFPGYVQQVFIRSVDGTIVTKKQDPLTGAFPATWTPVGTFVAGGDPAAILDPVRGQTVVVARGLDNTINLTTETAQGSGVFGDWNCDTTTGCVQSTADPVVAPMTNAGGLTWIITYRNINGAPFVLYQQQQFTGLAAFAATSLRAESQITAHDLPVPR